ncbi:hypothetical protein OAV41_01735 [Planctomycetota bacterium]|nr:hypothetical protein [Planctomycetota bacterium]
MKREASEAQATQATRAEESARRAAEVADLQAEAAGLQMPTETITESMPQATPVGDQPTFTAERLPTERVGPGPSPENLFPAELSAQTEVQPSAEGLAEVQATTMPMLGERGLYPTLEGTATAEQQEALYQEQLEDESVNRFVLNEEEVPAFGEYINSALAKQTAGQTLTAEENGVMNINAALDAGAKSFQFSAGQANIFGKQIPLSAIEADTKSQTDPMGFLKDNVDSISYSIKGDDKLNMSIDPADPNSEIRPEFGRAATMAVLLELGNRLNQQASEVDKPLSERRYDGVLSRGDIGKGIGSRIERLLYPTQQENPFTGETESFGYNYRLSDKERSLLGQSIVQGFADSPMFDWIEAYKVTSTSNNEKYAFRTTRDGEKKLKDIRKAAKKALNMEGHDRPVSLVPTKRGRLRGEGAYTQKEITTMVARNEMTETMVDAIEALSSVAHTVSPHKTLLMSGIMTAAQENRNGLMAKYTKQDTTYIRKKTEELLREYEARARMDGMTPQDLGNFDTFEQAANAKALQIVQDHFDLRMETLLDGIQRAGSSFYYGYTAINNSSRLQISQTELNYQADKVARFLVDGAVPALMIKGSNSDTEKGFLRVIARAVVPNADKMTPEKQLEELNKRKSDYIKMGEELVRYTEANAQSYTQAKQGNIQPTPALQMSEDLEKLMNEHGKDAFYFAIDGLHEFARYNRAKDGDKFYSRAKAEIDGNSNGAVIQAYQMGEESILRKGGILYNSVEDLESDIRDEVFDVILSYPKLEKETTWSPIFDKIKKTSGKVKELMKLPIMTSIYGKDPAFHRDTARRFVQDNPDLFPAELTYDEAVTGLTSYIQYGLEKGLGNALEHAKMAKRIGRAFNIADEILQINGANGYRVQAGGFEYIPEDAVEFRYGPGAERTVGKFTTYQRQASAAAEAKGVKIQAGKKNIPDLGSKLRNQAAVNGTQNIDATIAQLTVKEVIDDKPNTLVMQVYDAFMGDANSFTSLVDVSNNKFDEVNQTYNMLEAEKKAFIKLKQRVVDEAAKKKAAGETYDIGSTGQYKALGDLIARGGQILNRDMPGSYKKEDANYNPEKDAAFKELKVLYGMAAKAGYFVNKSSEGQLVVPKTVKIKPDDFVKLFEKAILVLNIEKDLNRMIEKTNKKRADVKRKAAGKTKYQFS